MFLRPHSFLSLFGERKEPPQRQKKPAPFRFRRGGESSIFAASFFLPESRPLRWVAFRLILEKKENLRNRKCKPCRHRVRRSQLHSVSAGAAKTPYPQPSSSFPNCDRFTGSQFGHLEFYNAARDLDDGGQKAFYEYGLWGQRKVEVRPVNRKNRPGSSEPGRSFYRCVPRKKIDTTPGPVCAPMTGPT